MFWLVIGDSCALIRTPTCKLHVKADPVHSPQIAVGQDGIWPYQAGETMMHCPMVDMFEGISATWEVATVVHSRKYQCFIWNLFLAQPQAFVQYHCAVLDFKANFTAMASGVLCSIIEIILGGTLVPCMMRVLCAWRFYAGADMCSISRCKFV